MMAIENHPLGREIKQLGVAHPLQMMPNVVITLVPLRRRPISLTDGF